MRDKDIYMMYGSLVLAVVRHAMDHYYPNDSYDPNQRSRNGASNRLTKDTILQWELVSLKLLGRRRYEESRMPIYSEYVSEIEKEFSRIRFF